MEKTLSAKEEKMKYTKQPATEWTNCFCYSMKMMDGMFVKVYLNETYPSIELTLIGCTEECSQKEFEQAFMTVSNRFRTSVFNDNTATRTETNDGNQTTIEIKPTK